MLNKTILVVDDEEDILELLKHNLLREGFIVETAVDGEQVLQKLRARQPDLIILDLMLPGMDGLEVARRLKADSRTAKIPILMVTAKGEDADVVVGLELGADDYIVKPFSPRVLMARVRAVLRRYSRRDETDDAELRVAGLVIHPGRRDVLVEGRPVHLTYTEFQVLHYLAGRPGWVNTRSQIVNAVRGDDYAVTERSVDVQIAGLRKKLGSYGRRIETVRGVGYRFRSTDTDSASLHPGPDTEPEDRNKTLSPG